MQLSNAPSGPGLEQIAIPQAAEARAMGPEAVAARGAAKGVEAAGVGIGNIMRNIVAPALPLVGIGFLTWLGVDMILGGALSHPFTPQSARRMA